MKRVRKPILQAEYKKLMRYVNTEEMKEWKRKNIQRAFVLLFYTGIRLNEINQITNRHIKELIEDKETIIYTSKTDKERLLLISDTAVKEIKKYFDTEDNENNEDNENRVIAPFGNPRKSFNNISLISTVNKEIQKALGNQYSSHSFRSGLISSFMENGINPKVVKEFIGHSSIQTTLGYYKPSNETIRNSLVR